jgi:hypothetical protein
MTLEQNIADLTTATTALTTAVNVSKTTLDQKVVEATTQANLATTNAATASTKASEASASATAASGSATAAAGSATTASTKAGEASTSATNAAASATAAAGSATTASTKASEASASATAAATSASNAANSQTAAAASALSAVNAPGTSGTSANTMTIALGSFTFTTQASKAWVVGQNVTVARTDAPANVMVGTITAYNSTSGSMTVQVTSITGSGTSSTWTIGLSGPNFGIDAADVGRNQNQVPLNQYLGNMAYQDAYAVNIGGGVATVQLRRRAPVTKTASFTLSDIEHWVICNGSATITVTLPDVALNVGREIMLKTIAAFTVVSAASNVVPLTGGSAGTAILAATAGKYATLVSDGSNWIVMQAN